MHRPMRISHTKGGQENKHLSCISESLLRIDISSWQLSLFMALKFEKCYQKHLKYVHALFQISDF